MPKVGFTGLILVLTLSMGCSQGRLYEGLPVNRSGGPGRPEGGAGAARSDVPPGLIIERPVDGELLERSPVRVQGTAGGVDRVEIAGRSFEVIDGRFQAELPLPDGSHELIARGEGVADAWVAFTVDAHGPSIELASPGPASYHQPASDGPAVSVRGNATDLASRVVEVTVNGQPVELGPKGAFSVQVEPPPGLSTIEVTATDAAGHTATTLRSLISGRFHPPGKPLDDALDIAVDAGALGEISASIEAMVRERGADFIGGVVGGGGGDFQVRDLRYSELTLDLDPVFGGFQARVSLRDLHIEVRVEKRVLLFDVVVRGSISARKAELSTLIGVSVTTDGQLDLSLQQPSVDLHGFSFDIEDFPGELEGWLRGVVRRVVENMLEDAMRGLVLPAMFEPADLRRSIEIGDKVVELELGLQMVSVEPNALRVRASTTTRAPRDPSLPESPGSLLGVHPAAAAEQVGAALELKLAESALNQLLHTAWAAGALESDVDLPQDGAISLDVGSLGALLGARFDQVASPDLPLSLHFRPLLPPVLRPEAPGSEVAATLLMGDALLTFRAAAEPPIPLLTVSVALETGLWPLDPDAPPALSARCDLVEASVELAEERVEAGVAALLQAAAPMLSGMLQEVSPDPGGPELEILSDGAGLLISMDEVPLAP